MLEVNQIYEGDCLELIRAAPVVRAVIADPPYVMSSLRTDVKVSWGDYINYAHWFRAWIGGCRARLAADGCLWVFLNWKSVGMLQKAAMDLEWSIESMMVWDKCRIGTSTMRGLRPGYEMVALFAMPEFAIRDRGVVDVQRFPLRRATDHPAEKPVRLIQFLIEHSTSEGDIVMDPFMGSGTTGVAAVQLDRGWIGIEQDAGWCKQARRRIEEATTSHNKIKLKINKYESK